VEKLDSLHRARAVGVYLVVRRRRVG